MCWRQVSDVLLSVIYCLWKILPAREYLSGLYFWLIAPFPLFSYRVGLPGFLHSPELKAGGYEPNNGLDDQRLAFRWIKRNIGGFGGDPEKVTFMGESAGACKSSQMSRIKRIIRVVLLTMNSTQSPDALTFIPTSRFFSSTSP